MKKGTIERPKLVVFCCNWCSYAGADNAGVSKMDIKPYFRIIRTMCSSRVEPDTVLEAFKKGAWGVLILGCHPGDCHYKNGNYKALRRTLLLKRVLEDMGYEKERLTIDWVSASEGERFASVVNSTIEKMIELGPPKNA